MRERFRFGSLLGNIFWFGIALIFAFWIWFVAVTSANPITQRTWNNIPVQILNDEGFVVTNSPTTLARVDVRAQSSVSNLLTRDDLVVQADVRGLGEGRHVVTLDVEVSPLREAGERNVIADTRPSQITIELELVEAQQKPLQLDVVGNPPTGFDYESPEMEVRQVEVRGVLSQVTQVASVVGTIDLQDQRNPVDFDVRITPVDADGQRVNDVELTPQTVRVSVNVFRRDDIKQVSVRPQIRVDTLPTGYVLSSISYDPQTIFVGGDLERLADSFSTESIDLSDQFGDFEISVPVRLPNDVFVIDGSNLVTVSLGISEVTTTRTVDNIPLEILGLDANQSVQVAPDAVSVVLNGPRSVVDQILPDDIQLILDLNGLSAGNYQVEPTVNIAQEQAFLDPENITLLPSSINVIISTPTPAAEVTETPSAEEAP